MKSILALILSKTYGVRGAVKPPLRGCKYYSIRYKWYKVLDRIYTYSGLPERWSQWRKSVN